ncbi:MAG: hypothetical protein BWY78_00802 [Alphaproteobacteria bacterium ADurb.Bin438]|nr:MAG: hypothetical protein BWY78_00802 [Alphaproteobacteria bacterium ADurb.Bin438]
MEQVNIISAKIKNFASFKDESEALFLAESKYHSISNKDWNLISHNSLDDDDKILPVTAIYGANASGKSNFLEAISSIKNLMGRGEKADNHNIKTNPFTLDKKSQEKNTLIELEFIIDNTRYLFVVEYNSTEIVFEKLSSLNKDNNENSYYNRKAENGSPTLEFDTDLLLDNEFKKKGINGEILLIPKRSDVLALESMSSADLLIAKKIYNFIKELKILVDFKNETMLEKIKNNNKIKSQVLSFLKSADTGIVDIKIKKGSELGIDLLKLPKNMPTELKERIIKDISEDFFVKFIHSGEDFSGAVPKESDGTDAYFNILLSILPAFIDGGIFIVDELERSLHPMLIKQVVDLFHNKKINKAGAQLIFTTHNTSLLNQDILRRDEILFAEKDFDGTSRIYPLSELNGIRASEDLEKNYIKGKYGAVPFLGNIKDLEKLFKEV